MLLSPLVHAFFDLGLVLPSCSLCFSLRRFLPNGRRPSKWDGNYEHVRYEGAWVDPYRLESWEKL